VKNQQTHQLLIYFLNYVWYLLHVSALHCHLFWEMLHWGADHRILWMGVLCLVTWCVVIWDRHAPHRNPPPPPKKRKLSQLEKYNFSGQRKTHWSNLENRRVTLFHYVNMVSGIPTAGITQNELFLSCDTFRLGLRYYTDSRSCGSGSFSSKNWELQRNCAKLNKNGKQ
jgi:hypothetical protein